MKRLAGIITAGAILLCAWTAGADTPAPAERAVPRTHAHNDYEHPHPLFDALSHGFAGVEADVYLVGRELRVAHDKQEDWSAVPTLEEAYLKPLSELKTKRNSGGIYPDGTPLLLLVDIKTDAAATYQRLHEVFAQFQSSNPGLFTTYTKVPDGRWRVTRGAVNVVISGNRPREAMARQSTRYAGYDGRRADIGPDVNADDAAEFVPLISENWKDVFTGGAQWDGTGAIPAATRAKLDDLVSRVHAEGKMLRFWNVPKDAAPAWGAQYDAGVDLINSDDLAGLSGYIKSRVPPSPDQPGK